MKEILNAMIELGLSSIAITYASKDESAMQCCLKLNNDLQLLYDGVCEERFLKDLSDIIDIFSILKPIFDDMGRGDVLKVGEMLIGVDKYSLKRIARYAKQFFTLIVNGEISVTMAPDTDLSNIKRTIISEIVSY
ncbi:MAG TPA: hypothetical protein EYP30_08745 [Archaeoglobaceae archaeon]|nr:hypothetical protein [Archaeoglobaceae archaeon]